MKTNIEKLADEYLEAVRGTPRDRRVAYMAGYKQAQQNTLDAVRKRVLDQFPIRTWVNSESHLERIQEFVKALTLENL